jgi:succinyl-CoA:acetate CoA-transferase
MTGASLGNDVDKAADRSRRHWRAACPSRSDSTLRAAINRGEVMFIDQHLSETVELLRSRHIAPIDVAVIEAVAPSGHRRHRPTTSVGNSASFAILADKVIVEINLAQPRRWKACTTSLFRNIVRNASRSR